MTMHLHHSPKHRRFPVSIISHAVWRYHRFNDSYRDIKEELAYRNIEVSHEAIRLWCNKGTVKLMRKGYKGGMVLDFRQQEGFGWPHPRLI